MKKQISNLGATALLGLSLLGTSSCNKDVLAPPTPVGREPETPQEQSSYQLKHIESIGAPMANPVGIASDQENLWLMFGEHNGQEHHLVYYDPKNFKTLKTFAFHNLIEELGTGVYGIAWDGCHVWISVSGNTNKLVRVNPHNGAIVKTWSSPSYLGPSDLTWDGEKLWLSSGTGEVFQIDPESGGSNQFLKYSSMDRDHGIAIHGEELWLGNLFDKEVRVYSKTDAAYLGSIENALLESGKFCFHQGKLAVLSEGGVKFYEVEN